VLSFREKMLEKGAGYGIIFAIYGKRVNRGLKTLKSQLPKPDDPGNP